RMLGRYAPGFRKWRAVAAGIAREIGRGDELVLYGMGRNSRALLHWLEDEMPGVVVRWIDDHEGATAPAIAGLQTVRTRIEELTEGSVVVVTPDDRERILHRLGPKPALRVWM